MTAKVSCRDSGDSSSFSTHTSTTGMARHLPLPFARQAQHRGLRARVPALLPHSAPGQLQGWGHAGRSPRPTSYSPGSRPEGRCCLPWPRGHQARQRGQTAGSDGTQARDFRQSCRGRGPLALLGLLSWWERIPGLPAAECRHKGSWSRANAAGSKAGGGEGSGALEAGLEAPSQQAQS